LIPGNKTYRGGHVPKLFDMCIRVLQENIEFLEYTGGVPFDLLKPVLEKATPDQLNNLEYFNPYLIDESDVLWEPHCKRKFRGQQPQEMESWRDMYAVSLIIFFSFYS
jgi:transcription elongation factor B polypeptide 3